MIDTTTVGRSIAYLRKQKQMTQQGLAAAVNVSHQAVSKWENGVALPDMQTMLTLSRLFGVSMEDLLSGAVLEAVEAEKPAAETPAQPDAPHIELKLDPDPLNMGIVAEADEAIARAMENCEDESETHEETVEPESTVNVGMTLDEILRMAPYVSHDTLAAMLHNCEERISIDELISVAPYVDKETLARLVSACERMDWETLRRLAPFLSRDALRALVLANVETLSLGALRRLAPFLSRDALGEILDKMPPDYDLAGLKRLASFLSRDTLAAHLQRYVDRLTVDDLLSFAPFLRKEALGDLVQRIGQPIDRKQLSRLASYLPREQMDKLVYRAMGMKPPKQKSDDWNVSIDLGRAYHEIRDSVHSGVKEFKEAIKEVGLDGVMDGLNSTMKDVGGRINDVINDAVNVTRTKVDPAKERSQRIRTRIAEKALADCNWDWLDAHIDELDGDLLKKVLMKCAEAGHGDMIADNLDRVTLSSAEACRLAQTCTDEDVWETLLDMMEPEHRQRVLDYIGRVQPEAQRRFERFAETESRLESALNTMRADGDVSEAMEELSANEQLELICAALREGYSDVATLAEHMDNSIALSVLKAVMAAGREDVLDEVLEHAQESELADMALILAENDAWQHMEGLLDGIADVDLTRVWPLAVNGEHWDVLDDIALHGDEATLTGMSVALAEQGRFEEMDSFIEELDPDTLETLLDKAMEQSNWEAIERISELINE